MVDENEKEGADGHVEEVLRHSRVIRDETEALVGEVRSAVEQVHRALDLQGRMERHPYATMATALGVGYVLGGGLFTRLSAKVLHFGARALLVPLIRNELQAIGEAALGQQREPEGGDPGEDV